MAKIQIEDSSNIPYNSQKPNNLLRTRFDRSPKPRQRPLSRGLISKSSKQGVVQPRNLLKNLPPFFPIPVPRRFMARTDLESGRHLNSLRTENKPARAGLTWSSLMLLQDTTVRLCRSFHDNSTDSSPSVVIFEHPSSDRSFTLLRKHTERNLKLRNI